MMSHHLGTYYRLAMIGYCGCVANDAHSSDYLGSKDRASSHFLLFYPLAVR